MDKCDEKDLTYTRILNNNNNQYTDLFSVYIAESQSGVLDILYGLPGFNETVPHANVTK